MKPIMALGFPISSLIRDKICEFYGVGLDDVTSNPRVRDMAMVKYVIMQVQYYYCPTMTTTMIGRQFNNTHAHVYSAIRKVNGWLDSYPTFKEEYTRVLEKCELLDQQRIERKSGR